MAGGGNHDWNGFHQLSDLVDHQRGVSGILHYGLGYYVTPGFWSFCSKAVIGWLGAWIGSPVVGNWPHRFPFLNWGEIWIIPAIIGCAGVLIVAVDLAKMARARVSGPGSTI